LLKVIINKNKQSKSRIEHISLFFKRNRNIIMIRNSKPIELIEDETNKDKKEKKKGEFNAHQDPEEFFTQLKSRFCEEFTHCEYFIHHLFGFYSDKKIILITVTILQLKEKLIIFYKLYFLIQGLPFLNLWKFKYLTIRKKTFRMES